MPRQLDLVKPKTILLDIDGTCMPISYFPNQMCPYLPNKLRPYVASHMDTEVMGDIIKRLRVEYRRKIPKDLEYRVEVADYDGKNGPKVMQDIYTCYMAQTDEGKKSETVLALAWLVWLDGFRQKDLKGEVFPDVPHALERWKKERVQVCTVSSMMSLGQQLLFTCSNYGNLDELIDGYLCTKDIDANKSNKKCFQSICDRLEIHPKELIFLTDAGKEAVAAKEAGCRSVLVERPGNLRLQPQYTRKFDVISSFSQISFI